MVQLPCQLCFFNLPCCEVSRIVMHRLGKTEISFPVIIPVDSVWTWRETQLLLVLREHMKCIILCIMKRHMELFLKVEKLKIFVKALVSCQTLP